MGKIIYPERDSLKTVWKIGKVSGFKNIAKFYGVAAAPLSYRVNDLGMSIKQAIDAGKNNPHCSYEINGFKGSLSEICEIAGLDLHAVYSRLKSGWALSEALHHEQKLMRKPKSQPKVEIGSYGRCTGGKLHAYPFELSDLWRLALGIGARSL